MFSIFAEAGIFNSHSSSTTIKQKLSNNLMATKGTTFLNNYHSNQDNHCAEDTCHIGHCHHTSTLSQSNLDPNSDQFCKYNLSALIAPLNPFLDGHKRPPRNS